MENNKDPATMEQRKLIRLGNSSFAIALPKGWIDKSGLKKGDKVFVMPNSNGEMIISSEFKKGNGEKKIVININGKNENRIKREFVSAYINGNSLFEFIGNIDKEKNKQIKKIVQEHISCEVIEEKDKKIVAKDFFNFEESSTEHFIRRIDNNIREMFEILIDSIEKSKIGGSNLKEIEDIDLDINKFYFLNSRIMIMGLNNPTFVNLLKASPTQLFNNWWFVFHLEHIGDNIKSIASKMKKEEITSEIQKILVPILKKVKEKFETSVKSFYSNDKEDLYDIMDAGKSTWLLCENLAKSKNALLSSAGENLKNIDNGTYQIIKMTSHLKNENGS